jgi:hypothetical protein
MAYLENGVYNFYKLGKGLKQLASSEFGIDAG